MKLRQENISDCGAVCLLYLIRYYKGNNSIDNIRYLTRCDKFGINAYNLISAAKTLGFEAKAFKLNLEELKSYNSFPCIVHLVLDKKYKHYVILKEIKKDKIIIQDFIYGVKKYKADEFLKIWSNVVIFLKPKRKLDKIKTSQEFYFNFFKKILKSYINIIMFSLLIILFSLINAFYFKLLIDKNYNLNLIYIVFILFIIIKSFLDFIRNKMLIKLDKKIEKHLYLYFYKKIISLPNYFFNTKQKGEFINIINDISYIQELYSKIFIIFFIDVVVLIIVSIILINISIKLYLMFILFTTIYVLFYFVFSRKINDDIINLQNKKGEVFSLITESINGINTIKNLNLENYIHNNYKNIELSFINEKTKFERKYNYITVIKDLIILININTVLFLGINTLKISDLILFNSLMIYFIEFLKDIFDLELSFKNGFSAIRRVGFIFNKYKVENYNIKKIEKIQIKNLTFSYNEKIILNNLNININKNDKIFINGKSGIGKTTLFNLLIKNHNIEDNMIWFNNVDINQISKNSILKNICYVTQNELIFNDTLYNNIVLDNIISKNKFKKICKMFFIKEIIKNKNLKYNDLILENGNDLSLGEKQRIILARSFLRDFEIIILDECLSNLNIELENKIIKRILKYYGNKTIIFVSHRKDNINLFNKIIDLNKKGVIYE